MAVLGSRVVCHGTRHGGRWGIRRPVEAKRVSRRERSPPRFGDRGGLSLSCLLERALGRFFREEIAQKLGLDFYIGLPPEIPAARLATIMPLSFGRALRALPTMLFGDVDWNERRSLEVEVAAGASHRGPWQDVIMGVPAYFSRGFMRPGPGSASFGSSPRSFGTPGTGGSFGS